MKPGKKILFKDLEIGQLFVWYFPRKGCNIYLKCGKNKTFLLASDDKHGKYYIGEYEIGIWENDDVVYELSESNSEMLKGTVKC